MALKATAGKPVKKFEGKFPAEIKSVDEPKNYGQGLSMPILWRVLGGENDGEVVGKLFSLRDDGSMPMGTETNPGKLRELWEQHFGPVVVGQEIDEQMLVGRKNIITVELNKRGYPTVRDFKPYGDAEKQEELADPNDDLPF